MAPILFNMYACLVLWRGGERRLKVWRELEHTFSTSLTGSFLGGIPQEHVRAVSPSASLQTTYVALCKAPVEACRIYQTLVSQ